MATALAGIIVTSWVGQVPATDSVQHPLDPLTASEYEVVLAALIEEEDIGDIGLYSLITLDEPATEQVLAWPLGPA